MKPQLPSTADEFVKPDQKALLTPKEFKALVARLHRNTTCCQALLGLTVFLVSIAVILSALLSMWVGLLPAIKGLFLYGLINALTIGLFKIHIRKVLQRAEHLLQFVTHTKNVSMLGPVLDLKDFLEMKEWVMRPSNIALPIDNAVDEAVLRLLPLVQGSYVTSLNWEQRTRIRHYFWSGGSFKETRGLDNLPYACGVLHALEHIGNKDDLPEIERMLGAVNITDELRVSMQHCAHVIQERAAREVGKDILLRPDRKPEALNTLLRPAAENADTPQQLLRASTSEQPDTKI